MKNFIIILSTMLVLASCSENQKATWQHTQTISLGNTTPIGFVFQGNEIWISDGDHNQLVAVSSNGEIQKTVTGFERPMHLDSHEGTLYVPEYGSNQIVKYANDEKNVLTLPDTLDAPAGVDVYGKEIAIADFYNHRIVYYNGQEWITFGREGKELGELHYPTDVQILSDKIIVADAYNNRIQIFDKSGNATQIIGQLEEMNATTGLFANNDEIYATDFENNRVLIFDYEGEVQQVITEEIDKPTDIVIHENMLYIANYKGKNLLKLEKK